MRLFKILFIFMLPVVGSLFITSCSNSKLDDSEEIAPITKSNLIEDAEFKELNLVKSKQVVDDNSIVFSSKDEAYAFVRKLSTSNLGLKERNEIVAKRLLNSLKKYNPEKYDLIMQSFEGEKLILSTNVDDEGALPDFGPRYRHPCTNALMEGNGVPVGFGSLNFHAQTDANGKITSVGTDLTGWTLGMSLGGSYFNTLGSTFNSTMGEYRVQATIVMNYNLFFEGVGVLWSQAFKGVLVIRQPQGGCGGGGSSIDFEMNE